MENLAYFLPVHVFLCVTSNHVVALDALRDRYVSIPRRQFELLTSQLNGWPGAAPASSPAEPTAPEPSVAKQLAALASQGILTTDPVESKPVCPISMVPARVDVWCDEGIPPLAAAPQFIPFYRACRRADVAMASRPFPDLIRAQRMRSRAGDCSTAGWLPGIPHLVHVFAALRLLYPRPPLCTFDSLALLEFLAPHRIVPRWVFGIRADPFHAHCWLQLGDVVLNDRIDSILRFTPIMSV